MIVNLLLLIFSLMILFCFLKNSVLAKKNKVGCFLNKESTGALRGATIIAIAFAHICQNAPEIKEVLFGGKYLYTLLFMCGGIGVAIFFLLSGYGCYISIGKATNKNVWLLKHMVKLLICFVVSFVFVLVVNCLILGKVFDAKEWALSLIMLKLPGTTSWYFKIQLLFYILLTVSETIKKRQIYLLSIFVFLYAVIANGFVLADYWWKTSFCFAAGCIIAKYKDKVMTLIEKNLGKLCLIFCGCMAVVYIRMDSHFILIPQLISYVCIAGTIVMMWDFFIGKNIVFEAVGKASLAMYLVHIGVVDLIYLLDITTEMKTLIFVLITSIGTTTCYLISEHINRTILVRFRK